MNLQKKLHQDPDISLTPMIDVVFLLLLFFMVSTTFNHESQISIDLPEASAQPLESDQIPVELSIDIQGHFFINKQQVVNTQINTLVKALRLVVKDPQEAILIISADGQSPHQAVVTAMDAARLIGISRLSLATKQSANSNQTLGQNPDQYSVH